MLLFTNVTPTEEQLLCRKYQCRACIKLGTGTFHFANIYKVEDIEKLNFRVAFDNTGNYNRDEILLVPDIKESSRLSLLIHYEYPEGYRLMGTEQFSIANVFKCDDHSITYLGREFPEIYKLDRVVLELYLINNAGNIRIISFLKDGTIGERDVPAHSPSASFHKRANSNSYICAHNGKMCMSRVTISPNTIIFVNPRALEHAKCDNAFMYLLDYFRKGVSPDARILITPYNDVEKKLEHIIYDTDVNNTFYCFIGYVFKDTRKFRNRAMRLVTEKNILEQVTNKDA